ncbi:class I SAM-dependent methyltransferase [Aureispira anguillae]|uniref:Methyltransferase domain-containing protein n=1 Tax=Aureispira anguillae TaxID=2864201 RepID=A0A916DS08_9BACT|nr:methyltransferase domain-containing protein [Aureispira anguillae]BDS11586.1 methyltransferase domain-containing protein [Aureispira anguillae]
MVTREPNWRVDEKDDWGFVPLTKKDLVKEFLSFPKQLYRLFKNQIKVRKLEKHLASLDQVNIALGSGTTVADGWIGFDTHRLGKNVYPVNLLLKLPLKDNSVDAILAEHIIEHFYYDDICFLLKECYRVLAPGGKIRIVCPDAKNIAELIIMGKQAEMDHDVLEDSKIHRWPDDGMRSARFINRLSHQWGQHKSLLSRTMLTNLLKQAGFEEIFQATDRTSTVFETLPDVHLLRFPNDSSKLNLAIEAIAKKNR